MYGYIVDKGHVVWPINAISYQMIDSISDKYAFDLENFPAQ